VPEESPVWGSPATTEKTDLAVGALLWATGKFRSRTSVAPGTAALTLYQTLSSGRRRYERGCSNYAQTPERRRLHRRQLAMMLTVRWTFPLFTGTPRRELRQYFGVAPIRPSRRQKPSCRWRRGLAIAEWWQGGQLAWEYVRARRRLRRAEPREPFGYLPAGSPSQ